MDNSNFNNTANDILKIEADIYFELAEKLMEENNKFSPEYIITQKDAISALVTSAVYGYAAELYLKFIISQFNETPSKGHNLYKIYKKIQTEQCLDFVERTFAQYFENDTEVLKKGLAGILKEIQQDFVDHRYIAERVQSQMYFNIRLDYSYFIFGYLKEITDDWVEAKYRD